MSEDAAYRTETMQRLVKQAEDELENIWSGLEDGSYEGEDKVKRGVIARTIVYGVAMPELDHAMRWVDRLRRGEPALTQEELSVVTNLGGVTRQFADLPEHHPEDLREWTHHVHALQNMVMARAALRAVDYYPWTPMRLKEGPPPVDTDAEESGNDAVGGTSGGDGA